MKNIRYITIILLVFIGLNALAGGYLLIEDPAGGLLGLDILQVELTWFDDFLIPGLLLFVFIGLLSIVTTFFVLYQWKGFAWLVLTQGMILSGWILVQIYFFDQISLMQYLVLVIALGLLVCGMRLQQLLKRRKELSENHEHKHTS